PGAGPKASSSVDDETGPRFSREALTPAMTLESRHWPRERLGWWGRLRGHLNLPSRHGPGDGVGEIPLSEGLGQPGNPLAFSWLQFSVAGDQYDRQIRPLRTDFRDKLGAGHARHRLVGDDEIDVSFATQDFKCARSGRCAVDAVAELLQKRGRIDPDKRIVIHGEDRERPAQRDWRLRRDLFLGRGRIALRDAQIEFSGRADT